MPESSQPDHDSNYCRECVLADIMTALERADWRGGVRDQAEAIMRAFPQLEPRIPSGTP